MDHEVKWDEQALADVEESVRWLAGHSPDAAEELRAAFFDSVRALRRFPEIGAVYEKDRSGRTREIVCRDYRIFYRPDLTSREVRILLVRHASRREPRLPR